jgi:hypothetical protein
MASRRDSASERLKESIEAARNPLPPERSLIALGRKYGMIPEAPQEVDWNNRARRAVCADEALRLNLGELDEPIQKAFAVFGYDPNNPFDWRKLIWHFAFAHFPPPPKKGPPTKWDDVRWCQLLSDFGEVKASRPNASDNEVCFNIKKRFAQRYAREKADTLRRNLQYARNPSRNGMLASLRDRFAMEIRNWAIAQFGGSTSPEAGTFNPMALDLAREYLESAWKRRKGGPRVSD